MPSRQRVKAARSTGESLREYGRGVAGGLLFSLPLLFTMEVWQGGFTMPPERQLIYVLLALVLLLGYNRYAGLHPDVTWAEVAIDSVEEMGIGLLLSALVLLLIGRISAGAVGRGGRRQDRGGGGDGRDRRVGRHRPARRRR